MTGPTQLKRELERLEKDAAHMTGEGSAKTPYYLERFFKELENIHRRGARTGSSGSRGVTGASDADLEALMCEHGTILGMWLGEDEIVRDLRERPGPLVRETSPGVYE